MSRNNLQLYVHLFFVTKNRDFMILPKLEKPLHTFLWSKAEELEVISLHINGMQDHLHILLKITGTVTISYISQQLKGTSSRFMNETTRNNDFFEWPRD